MAREECAGVEVDLILAEYEDTDTGDSEVRTAMVGLRNDAGDALELRERVGQPEELYLSVHLGLLHSFANELRT